MEFQTKDPKECPGDTCGIAAMARTFVTDNWRLRFHFPVNGGSRQHLTWTTAYRRSHVAGGEAELIAVTRRAKMRRSAGES